MSSARTGRLGVLVVYAWRNASRQNRGRRKLRNTRNNTTRNTTEHISPECDFRKSKSSLSKSKEKVSAEEEKLLEKDDEAKIMTRVDMADAKYVIEDHRNGDAKIELDAKKRQYYGLTKEELMKYAEDPFWVRLRWFMFILFWALWLLMLAAAITIIVRAPKCPAPPPKTWYQKGPLVDMSSVDSFENLESELTTLNDNQVQGIFINVCKGSYDVLEIISCLDQFKKFVTKAKDKGIQVIVDLTANFVPKDHQWFALSANRTAGYEDYFVWGKEKDFNETGEPNKPNKWVSTLDTPAWSFNEQRNEFYLHQYGENNPDLNFTNPKVVEQFDRVLKLWMEAGAGGIRLSKARELIVNELHTEEHLERGKGAHGTDHTQYQFWQHRQASDRPELQTLLAHWAHIVDHTPPAKGLGETVFTLLEERSPELFIKHPDMTYFRPPSAAPLSAHNATELERRLKALLPYWPAVQLVADEEGSELATLAMLLPAAPVLQLTQLTESDNSTDSSQKKQLRNEASIEHGHYTIAAVPAQNGTGKLFACARWKVGHMGYVGVYNAAAEERRADLSALSCLPGSLFIQHVAPSVTLYPNYVENMEVSVDNVLVPAKSTVLLAFVPKTEEEK